MNELAVIASETHEKAIAYFKVAEQYGYKFIMEVKKIREERLYKEIGFTSFDDYCEKSWKTVRRSMDERIQIADASGGESGFESTYSQLGHSKSLLLARMEPEVREQIQATHDVSDLTVKKLNLLEKELREKEELLETTKHSADHWQKVAKQAQNMPPRIQTHTVEVVPNEVKKKLEQLEFDNTNLRHGYKNAKEKLQHFELQNTVEFNSEQAQKQREKLQHEADYNTLELRVHISNFMEKVAITSYMRGALTAADPITKRKLQESVEMLEEFTHQIKSALNGRILGGIVNE